MEEESRQTLVCFGLLTALVCLGGNAVEAQDPPPRRLPADSVQQPVDSLPTPVDTAVARQLGLPTAPSRSLPSTDSVMQALLAREGYGVTRYASDSLSMLAATSEIRLKGNALVEREGSMLEADSIDFFQEECLLVASGEPALFDGETVLVGGGMNYNTCDYRGIISDALTKLNQFGVDWFMRGELAVDSASTRVYGARTVITTCDHPVQHYHFAAGSIKWVSNNLLVARPAVLYIRDVPVMWLPFLFQDMRQGRHSGILVPRIGVNDVFRSNSGYKRQVTNVGYYFAINDYVDFQASLDWFSGTHTALNGEFRYRWLNRFVNGSLGIARIFEAGVDDLPGGRSMRLQWNHQQSFNQRTRLTAAVDFATSARVIQQNAVDPLLQTATLGSRINFSKQFDWGTLTIGGNRTQDLSNNTVSQTLPSVSLSPAPVNIGELVTWSPSFSLTRTQRLHQQPGFELVPAVGAIGGIDSLFPDQSELSVRIATPIRIGRWNWQNDLSMRNFTKTLVPASRVNVIDPTDSTVSSTRYYAEDFGTSVDWNTGINLPSMFPATWKLQPSVSIRNITGGAFMIRNRNTNGAFVQQGKRLSFGASMSPAVFGFFPGLGPISRIRHSLSPRVSWNFQPAAEVPEEYARALAGPGGTPQLQSPTTHSLSFSLSQVFEGKMRPAPGDTTSDPRNAPKMKLLSIQTSSIGYDFEQAKEEGRTGWVTQSINNSLASDLLRGFSFSIAHNLWDGPVGFEGTRLAPSLTSMSARFSVTGATFSNIFAMFTGGETKPEPENETGPEQGDLLQPQGTGMAPPRGMDRSMNRLGSRPLTGTGFRASVTYDDQRSEPREVGGQIYEEPANRTLGLQFGFSPTDAWSASWNTQYNITNKEFGQHILRLDRDMHRWRATFSFVKAPNGNFAFNFFVSLIDQPDIKFQYDQRNVQQGGGR
ncbi:putative LPS assembly protein LptD [Gemmatimonadota bacterium]